MKANKLIALALLLPSLVMAGQSLPIKDQVGFDTMNDAATAAVRAITTTETEQMGGVYSSDGKFYFTQPVGNEEVAAVSTHILLPRGSKLVAVFHNHPKAVLHDLDTSEYFSECDINLAKSLKVTSYILVIKDNTIHSFTPGQNPIHWMGQEHAALGTLIVKS